MNTILKFVPLFLGRKFIPRFAKYLIKYSLTTVKPPNSDHIGDGHFGHYSEVGLISEVLFVMGVFAVIIGENEF